MFVQLEGAVGETDLSERARDVDWKDDAEVVV